MIALPMSDYVATGGDVAAIVETLRRDQVGPEIQAEWPLAILRTVRPGSAGVVLSISGYEPYVPHAGSGAAVVDLRAPARRAGPHPTDASSTYQRALAMSAAEQMQEVLAALALNKSQMADVLGVTRPTLYDWLDDKEPNAANAERLSTLVRNLASSGISSTSPLNARFVRHPLEEGGRSLLEELKASPLDEQRIRRLLETARKLGEATDKRRQAREERLRGLGYEEPSDQERRERLGRTVAALDWPKR
jgi:DNA-binding XRE family transcriptional regulator